MADLILFHHAQGLTDGVAAFADQLRQAGHSVTVPDLYDGATFATVDEGVAHAGELGLSTIIAAAEQLSERIVYAGFSLGALPAQKLAQTRPGALIYHGDVPATTFGETWPAGVDLQVHANDQDAWCELDAVQGLVDSARISAHAEMFIYQGSTHLFTDSSLPEYEPDSTALVVERTLEFLDRHR